MIDRLKIFAMTAMLVVSLVWRWVVEVFGGLLRAITGRRK